MAFLCLVCLFSLLSFSSAACATVPGLYMAFYNDSACATPYETNNDNGWGSWFPVSPGTCLSQSQLFSSKYLLINSSTALPATSGCAAGLNFTLVQYNGAHCDTPYGNNSLVIGQCTSSGGSFYIKVTCGAPDPALVSVWRACYARSSPAATDCSTAIRVDLFSRAIHPQGACLKEPNSVSKWWKFDVTSNTTTTHQYFHCDSSACNASTCTLTYSGTPDQCVTTDPYVNMKFYGYTSALPEICGANDGNNNNNNTTLIIIIGASVGGVVVIAAVVATVCLCRGKKKGASGGGRAPSKLSSR